MAGTETPAQIEGNAQLMATIEKIRCQCCKIFGLVEKAEDVRAFFANPSHPYSKSLVGLSKKYAIS